MNPEVERLWPDPDRRDAALLNVLLRVHRQSWPRLLSEPARTTLAALADAAEEAARRGFLPVRGHELRKLADRAHAAGQDELGGRLHDLAREQEALRNG